LPFEDGFFDLIFSVSIFTHLPEKMQIAWLEELRRASKPGALVLSSVHGELWYGCTEGGGFGHLEYSHTMRWVVPGVTLAAVGFQTLLSGFFACILGMHRRN